MAVMAMFKGKGQPEAASTLAAAADARDKAGAVYREALAADAAALVEARRIQAAAQQPGTAFERLRLKRDTAVSEMRRGETAEAVELARVAALEAERRWAHAYIAVHDHEARERFERLAGLLDEALEAAQDFAVWARARDGELLNAGPASTAHAAGLSFPRYAPLVPPWLVRDEAVAAESVVGAFLRYVRAQFGW
jgi:hypothetical protein